MANPDEVVKKLIKRLADFKIELGKELLARIQYRTPIRTGALQKSWKLTMGTGEFNITNPLPYAGYVENGTPHERPAGMVAITLRELSAITAQVAKKVGA